MSDGLILAHFRLEGKSKAQIDRFTYAQYENPKALPITLECKILMNGKSSLSKNDRKLVNKRILRHAMKTKPYFQYLVTVSE